MLTRALTLIAICLLTFSLAAEPHKLDCEDAAWHWLALIDKRDYPSAWEESGSLMRDSLDSDQLALAIDGVRNVLGQIGKRELVAAEQTSNLPDIDDGNYIVFSFRTKFGDELRMTETLTMSHEQGRWAVIGYFIR